MESSRNEDPRFCYFCSIVFWILGLLNHPTVGMGVGLLAVCPPRDEQGLGLGVLRCSVLLRRPRARHQARPARDGDPKTNITGHTRFQMALSAKQQEHHGGD